MLTTFYLARIIAGLEPFKIRQSFGNISPLPVGVIFVFCTDVDIVCPMAESLPSHTL